ncbi:hypothetical protein MNBD_GAMMA09-337 [hydrothermal vent metagenome]|uniref:HEAT repeat domain-containing protein n=1 Tax=hydrothermal vent metagenome TaxID=652676 RepID=A0A3B0XSY9_9ZZZZ
MKINKTSKETAENIKIDDIFEQLRRAEVDDKFLHSYYKYFNHFGTDMGISLYNNLVNNLNLENHNQLLAAITHYLNTQIPNKKLASNISGIFSKLSIIKSPEPDIRAFANSISEIMVISFADEEHKSLTQEYYKILYRNATAAPYLPEAAECAEKLFDNDRNEQEKAASYLSCMGKEAKSGLFSHNKRKTGKSKLDAKVIKRLQQANAKKYSQWKSTLTPRAKEIEPLESSNAIKCKLIDVLGNIQSADKEAHRLLVFLLSSNEHKVKDHAISALKKIGCHSLDSISLYFNKLPEDYARAAAIEVLASLKECRREVLDFLNNTHTEIEYIQEHIDELKSKIST